MSVINYLYFFIKHWCDIPKTLWVNFRVLPLMDAIKLPVLVSYRVRIKGLRKNAIKIESENLSPFMVKIGIDGVEGISPEKKGLIVFGESGCVVFEGRAQISKGISIRCGKGTLRIGKGFYCNCNMSVICTRKIVIGKDVLLGWNVHLRDCDGHKIYQDGVCVNEPAEVVIGNHVWIGQDVKVQKGVNIPDDTVIAMNSCVTKSFSTSNCIIGGVPAKVLKERITWEV